jgi:hypothetical protein
VPAVGGGEHHHRHRWPRGGNASCVDHDWKTQSVILGRGHLRRGAQPGEGGALVSRCQCVEGEKLNGNYLGLICDEQLTCFNLNLNLEDFDDSTLLSVLYGETCLIVLYCVGDICCMVGSDEDQDRSSRLGAEDRDDQTQFGYSVVERLRCRMTMCVVCTVHKETRSVSFLV